MTRATKPALLLFAALSVIAAAGSALAGPYEEAKAARDRGDDATALRLWRPFAEAGDADAQFWLGTLYDLGQGAAHTMPPRHRGTGKPPSGATSHNLAHMYENGQGLPADYALSAACGAIMSRPSNGSRSPGALRTATLFPAA